MSEKTYAETFWDGIKPCHHSRMQKDCMSCLQGHAARMEGIARRLEPLGFHKDGAYISAKLAKRLLEIRAALANEHTAEAYHALYSIADPTFFHEEPWRRFEEIAEHAEPDYDIYLAQNPAVAMQAIVRDMARREGRDLGPDFTQRVVEMSRYMQEPIDWQEHEGRVRMVPRATRSEPEFEITEGPPTPLPDTAIRFTFRPPIGHPRRPRPNTNMRPRPEPLNPNWERDE